MLPIAILAGGLATRLRPITEKIPKALVDIAGKPFIVHQLDLLKRQGIEHVVLCVGYLGEMINDLVGKGDRFDLQIEYSYDGPVLLGTGGSLKKALPLLGDSFFVLYGDSYLGCDYKKVQFAFEMSGKPALMTILRNEDRWDKSNILYQDGRIMKYDKKHLTSHMKYIDYGLSVLSKDIFTGIDKESVFDLAELYKDMVDTGRMASYEVSERFYEIGSHQGIEEISRLLEPNKMNIDGHQREERQDE